MNEILTAFRAFNVFLFILTALALYIRFSDVSGGVSKRFWLIFGPIVATFVLIGIGSMEAYAQSASPGYRGPAGTVIAVALLIGLWMTRKNPWVKPPSR